MELEESEMHGHRTFVGDGVMVVELAQSIITAGNVTKRFDADMMIFMSRHKSADNVKALTVHATGNWSESAEYGGEPKTLSVAAPYAMACALRALEMNKRAGFEVTYEATHHGPTVETPSFFIEAGGPDVIEETAYAAVANALNRSIFEPDESGEPAIGIGSGHYPKKFTSLAAESKYALGHIMPKYHCANIDMLESAVKRSVPKATKALIEWKSLKSAQRSEIIKALDAVGIDQLRV
jgi:D-aminoacyl-tRNA deacylase